MGAQARRFSKIDLLLLAGLGVAVCALLLFGWISEEVLAGGTQQLDEAVRAGIHRHASPPLTGTMRLVTLLGSPVFLVLLAILLVIRFWGQGRKRAAVLFVITALGAELLDEVLKLIFHRTRPEPFFGLSAPITYSFPSGHALVSCCYYGVLAAIWTLRMPRGRWLVWTGAAVLVAAIGFSRLYLGVHYLSDVMAGYAAALVWVAVVALAYRRVRGR